VSAPEITAAELAGRAGDDQPTVLDVREDWEWEAGHVAGSVHIPLGELGARVGELSADRPIVVVCRSGVRSQMAADAMSEAGWDAANLAGGLIAWHAAGLPLEPPGHVA
jgi:rhodanese-related sulfurtransferase